MLKQMDLDITTNSNLEKNSQINYIKIITNYKKKYDENKSKYFKTKETYTYTKKMEEIIISNEKDNIMDSDSSLISNSDLMGQQKLIDKYITASNSSEKLEKAKRTAVEMENISKNVMIDIESQTQKLKSTNAKINDMNTSIENSKSILARIINREHRNRAILGIFSVTLVTLFILILYTKSA